MNGKIFSGAISSLATYLAGIYIKFFGFIPVEKTLTSPELQALHEATRDTVTFYMQNAAFAVSMVTGIVTMFFLIRNNLKRNRRKNAEETN